MCIRDSPSPVPFCQQIRNVPISDNVRPMRLRGIGPEVLLLCFLVVGVAAFVLGRRSARARRVRGDTEYFAGLDHLVNDRYDRAAEVFTRLATKSHEAEIQFALGSLMRRRGEVDRAILYT